MIRNSMRLCILTALGFSMLAIASRSAGAQTPPPPDGGAPQQSEADASPAIPDDRPDAARPVADAAPEPTAPEPGVERDAEVAGDGGPETTTQLENVVVTAEHHNTVQQQTPIAITSFSPTVMQDRDIGSLRDLAGQVPNLAIARANISYTTQTYALRGIGETDPIQEPVVAIYVDDVYQPRQIASMPDFADIQRVEVLRGPQGTLYGRNTNAGAIRIISADPSNEFHTLDSVTYGSFNTVKAIASVSGPIVRDRLYVSASFMDHRRDGIDYDPTLQQDVNRIGVNQGRVKIRWTPADAWDIQATLNGMIDRSDTRAYIPATQPTVLPGCPTTTPGWECPGFSPTSSYSGLQPRNDLDQGSASIRAIYKASPEVNLKLISAGGGFDQNPVWFDNAGVAALVQRNLIHYEDGYQTDELQLNGDYGWLNFATGLFYLHERFFVQRDGESRKNAMNTDPTINPSNYAFLRAHNATTTNAYAIFGQADLKFLSLFTLTGGLRGTYEEKTFAFHNYVLNLQELAVANSIAGEASKSWAGLTPKASLTAQWTPTFLNYITYSRGFRAGGFDNRATLLVLAETPFNPEYVDNYEFGLKSDWLDHHLRANFAAFYDNYTDLQVSYTEPQYPGNSIRGNAGKATSAGLEAETEARLPFGLSLQASGGYLDAYYNTYNNCGGPGVNCGGNPLINAPRWNFVVAGTLDIPLPVPGYVRLGGDVEWSDKAYSSALARPQDQYPEQAFVNGTLSWTSENDHFLATLSSRNLLNSQKPVSASYTPSSGILFYNFADPRTVLFTLKYQD